ncbi:MULTISPECIES: hypothetical protein [Nonomuraea]|uniref:Uncharacterized protein n=1 Tax=Nonomuraea ferruginea TaxID=46174 RepID=A0ABT4ST32_9ACTN|nr:hypothetical protein [Nonomuraea ferruginea]MDA0640412.1 hypothetical protein [Nonomuraea ferruginea]
MSRTQGPALRGAAYLGAVLVSAALLLVALVALAPTEDDRFAGSVAGMEEVARSLAEGEELGERTVGGLTFERVFRENGLVYFELGRGWLGDRAHGYVRSPQGRPDGADHVAGPWYRYRDAEG